MLNVEDFAELLTNNPKMKDVVININIKTGRLRPAYHILEAMGKVFGKPVPQIDEIILYT